MTEQERNLIRDAMMFAVKDITSRVMREATVQSMIDDFKKAINYTHCCKIDSELLVCKGRCDHGYKDEFGNDLFCSIKEKSAN